MLLWGRQYELYTLPFLCPLSYTRAHTHRHTRERPRVRVSETGKLVGFAMLVKARFDA